MSKEEATALIRQTLDEILFALGEDFDLLEEATDDALNAIYTESQAITET